MIALFADLQKLSGLKRRSDVRRWLTNNGIAFMVQPSGDPVTTLEAINIALHGNSKYNKPNWSPYPGVRNKPDFSDPPGARRAPKKATPR